MGGQIAAYKRSLYLAAALALCLAGCRKENNEMRILVGTYGEAIHELAYYPSEGKFREIRRIPALNSSYLALDGESLYAVSENGAGSGAYSFARKGGKWIKTAFVGNGSADPCHILVSGAKVYTADYSGASLSSFALEDGVLAGNGLSKLVFTHPYAAGAPVPGRQDSAHIHQLKAISIDGSEYLIASDLGSDCLHLVKREGLELVKDIPCGEGTGPRHMEYNAETQTLYCLSELSGELMVWKLEGTDFEQMQRIKVDEADAGGSADLHLSADGRFLYCSHRLKNDGISILSVSEDGSVEKIGYRHTGAHPRHFSITPDGSQMIVACKDSHSLEVYDIDNSSGLLSELRCSYVFGSDSPVCIIFEAVFPRELHKQQLQKN